MAGGCRVARGRLRIAEYHPGPERRRDGHADTGAVACLNAGPVSIGDQPDRRASPDRGPNADHPCVGFVIRLIPRVFADGMAVDGTTFTLHGPEPDLGSGSLPKGRKAAGWLVYEVPKSGEVLLSYGSTFNFTDAPPLFEVLLRKS